MNKIITSIVGIAIILAIAALSRPAGFHSFQKSGKSYAKPMIGVTQGAQYTANAREWLHDTLWPQASREVAKIQQPVQQEIARHKDNFFQNMWKEATAYLAQKFSQLSGTPVSGANCPQE